MNLAEKAIIVRARGDVDAAKMHIAEALRLEERAARLAVESGVPEPTRTILLKSAAHLAVDAGEFRMAEQLICTALAGEPPEELAEELRSAFEEIGFCRHLDLRGVQLQHNDVQMVMVGDAIAPGMVASDQFVKRVEVFQRLIYRTSESDRNIKYRERGDPNQAIAKSLQTYVSVPRAASFAVSLKVASQKAQGELRFSESSIVLDNLMDRLSMFERADYEALSRAIPTQDYYSNFIRLANELAPDGELVKMVGFTMQRDMKETRLQLRRSPKSDAAQEIFVPSGVRHTISGSLYYYNETAEGSITLKLHAEGGGVFRLKASDEMTEKAKRYLGRRNGVVVSGHLTDRATLAFDKIKPKRPPQITRKMAKEVNDPLS